MLWLSTALIVVFGGLTVFLGDPVFVQVKPTIIYALFGVALLAAWARSTPLLQILLATAFEGVDRAGWLLLSRNWGVFFLALAGVNEVLRATLSFEGWLWAKFWVFLPLTFAFTFTQIPMLLRHGLNVEARDRPLKEQPPTGE
jgi:intracellular septation protein